MKKNWVWTLVAALIPLFSLSAQAQNQLHLDVYVADENGWCVTSTIIYGKTESVLVDTQFLQSNAAKLADRIAATGTHLKAVIITHPHDDHYMGIATIRQRFPDTPIYISAAGLEEFKRSSSGVMNWLKKNMPAEAPDSLPAPEIFPTNKFVIDGQAIEIKDGQGDEISAHNNFVWIPSLRAVVAGDMVFNQVHVWLATSNEQSRAAWLNSLDQLAALQPRTVVAGHKKNAELKDDPESIEFTREYIREFEAARKTAANVDELIAAMKAKRPNLALADKILWFSAKKSFQT